MNPKLKRILIIVGVSIAALLLLLLGWFIVNRGYIIIANKADVSAITYVRSDEVDSRVTTESTDGIMVTGGQYRLEIDLKNGTSYLADVTVPAWFGSVTVTPAGQVGQVTKIGANSLSGVMPVGDKLLSYAPGKAIISLQKSDAFGGKNKVVDSYSDFSNLTPVGTRALIATGSGEGLQNTSRLMAFFTGSGRFLTIDESVSADRLSIIATSDKDFLVVDADKRIVTHYRLGDRSVEEVSVVSIKDMPLAVNNGAPIVSANNLRIAVASGADYVPSSDIGLLEDAPPTNQPINITVYDYNLKPQASVSAVKNHAVQAIILSPNSTYLAASSDDALRIYDVNNNQLVYASPFPLEDIIWTGDDQLVAKTTLNGIYKLSVKDRAGYSLFDNSVLNITDLSGVYKDKLYFTAFSSLSDQQTNPNAYTVDMKQPATDNNQLVAKLPYISGDFVIDHSMNRIYIKPLIFVGSSGISNPADVADKVQMARDYISENIGNYQNYDITVVR